MYPATITDAFGRVHKATVTQGGLMQHWVWGKGTLSDIGDGHFQVNIEINGSAYLIDFSNTPSFNLVRRVPDYFMQCNIK